MFKQFCLLSQICGPVDSILNERTHALNFCPISNFFHDKNTVQRWLSWDVLAYDSDKYWLLRVYEPDEDAETFHQNNLSASHNLWFKDFCSPGYFFFLLGLILSLTHELMPCLACPQGGDGCLHL